MFYSILRSFLGSFSIILDFFATRTEWIAAFFCLYLGMYAIARVQLSGIKKITKSIIETQCKEWLADHQNASDKQIYSFFLPIWESALKKSGYIFILNKYDFWPVPITPESVSLKIHISPKDIRGYLKGEKIRDFETKERIILAQSKRKRN